MAAPSPSVRGTPSGAWIGDGYQTLVAFEGYLTIAFWEKAVTPPGIDGMAASETATMHNKVWRTVHSRRLKTLTEFSMTALYDPAIYTDILALVNFPTTVTVLFPNGDTLAFYGFLQSFKPSSLEDGKVPECTITVTPTNEDPTNCAEEGPTYTAATGTQPCW